MLDNHFKYMITNELLTFAAKVMDDPRSTTKSATVMENLTVTTEFLNRRDVLDTAISLLQGVYDGLAESNLNQVEALQTALRYLCVLKGNAGDATE